MEIEIKPGKYILAVSGGVDSMVLLDLLAKKPDIELIVAHFNHGIRDESPEDEKLVAQKAQELGLALEVGYGRLGNYASEEAAREARYRFLQAVRLKHNAGMVITAHHQDDLIETAFINLLRGTGRRGLSAISSNRGVLRPLLSYSKEQIITYAAKHKLSWNEDKTNEDNNYLRNYLRNNVIKGLTLGQRQMLIKNIDKVAIINQKLNPEIAKISQVVYEHQVINRSSFALLPSGLAEELVAYWLRQNGLLDFDRKTVNRINTALRTFKGDSWCPVAGRLKLKISKKTARFSYSV
jgi:tRNA(Ile)-lysidine synthase